MQHAAPLRLLTDTALPILIVCVLIVCVLSNASLAAPSPVRLNELSDTVQALLDAHDRIKAETRAADIPAYAEARNLLATARERMATGETAAARDLLQRAYDDATQVIIGDRAGQTLTTQRTDQYAVRPATDRDTALVEARIEAVRALADAYGRVAPEKGGIDHGALAEVDRRLEAAQSLTLTNRAAEARIQAEAAYAHVSTLVIGVRQGDRLVKTLAFDSPADEYTYELDRHASYRMLLRLSVAEQGKENGTDFRRAETEAESGKAMADTEAKAGHWPEAIRLLERSTARVVDAIRASGRFIPG
ncbi:MAG: hypothetical protein H7Z12_04830 [Rhodospirillaceae bacterium]|nr:hypothetical protein [Rhodospirillales bacterium]